MSTYHLERVDLNSWRVAAQYNPINSDTLAYGAYTEFLSPLEWAIFHWVQFGIPSFANFSCSQLKDNKKVAEVNPKLQFTTCLSIVPAQASL